MGQKLVRDTVVVVPTYNEARNISALIAQISEVAPNIDILVVDDNSPDGTAQIVRELQPRFAHVHLHLRLEKEGLGRAYVAGFKWALENGFDRVIQMDADFSHSPKDLLIFAEALNTHDVVVGTRYINGGGIEGWGWLRKAISRWGNIYAQIILSLPQTDLTGGFNAWTRKALRQIDFESVASKGYAFQVELKYRANMAGLNIKEQPIYFRNRIHGESKMTGSIVSEAAVRVWQIRFDTRIPRLYEATSTP